MKEPLLTSAVCQTGKNCYDCRNSGGYRYNLSCFYSIQGVVPAAEGVDFPCPYGFPQEASRDEFIRLASERNGNTELIEERRRTCLYCPDFGKESCSPCGDCRKRPWAELRVCDRWKSVGL